MNIIKLTSEQKASLDGIKITRSECTDAFVNEIVKTAKLTRETSLATLFDSVS